MPDAPEGDESADETTPPGDVSVELPVEAAEDVALRPGPNADSDADIERYVGADVRSKYDVYSYRHAAAILRNSYPSELAEIEAALLAFSVTTREVASPGGNESEMPKKFSRILRPQNWVETRIHADLHVELDEYTESVVAGRLVKQRLGGTEPRVIKNYIDGHKIDYVKGRVAFDLEWNSKDQTFDRDLYALRTFHECGLISAGVVVTRSAMLNPVFEVLPILNRAGEVERDKNGRERFCKSKYGASTTWMGKLLYRLNAGRHGGCPILAFGIRPTMISDWESHERNPSRRSN